MSLSLPKHFSSSSLDTHRMNRQPVRGLILMVSVISLGFFNLSCKGDIGDECITSAQCQAGQICDLISAGGYCTISPCEPDLCPQDSVCVTFENDDQFCMATCQSDNDCREGYRCDQELASEPFCRQSVSD